MSLKLTRPLVFIDLETTGTNVMNDRIVQIGMIRLDPSGEEQTYEKLINPGIPIPNEASQVHGITDAMVKSAPPFGEVVHEVNQFLHGADLAGYNHVKFDLPLLMEEMARAEVSFDLEKRRLVDAQRIFFLMEPRNLSAAYRFYCDKELDGAHSAMEDVKATLEVLKSQVERYKGMQPEIMPGISISENMEDLHQLTVGKMVDLAGRLTKNDQGALVFNFGKYKGRKVLEVFEKEPQYYDWIMRSEFPQDTKRILTQEKLKQRAI